MKTIYHIARRLTAIILLQTLFYKFGAHPESVELFTQIGMEPHGRIATGIVELIAGVFLVWGGGLALLGGILGVFLMVGAVYYHVTILGFDLLFVYALIALLGSLYVIWFKRKKLISLAAQ